MGHVYRFDDPALMSALPSAERRRRLLGGKGAGLAEMTALGVPVPPGFTLTTEVGAAFRAHGVYPSGVREATRDALDAIEAATGRRLGDPAGPPLLVSVRSGAAQSMPGMMDTVLNLGLSEQSVEALARHGGDRRFAYDAYRRFLQMFGVVVLGLPHRRFEEILTEEKTAADRPTMRDAELSAEAMQIVARRYREELLEAPGDPLSRSAEEQLWQAIGAVFRSWDNARARRYRAMQGIDDPLGTACTVQAMVFGNLGDTSGSGVAFTRNPSNGAPSLYGEFLPNAQGEDVVAGIRTPWPLTEAAAIPGRGEETLERALPEAFAAIAGHASRLEAHFGDMQDIEFTIEAGEPYILQTRRAKRTGKAAVRIAVDLVREGAIDRRQALLQVDAGSLDQLLHARLPSPTELAASGVTALATGLPASPGAATGVIVFDADEAERRAGEGEEVILVRRETSPEDIHGMKAAVGILTATGGMTSHAAVVARGLGKCCVAGCSSLSVDYREGTLEVRPRGGGARVTFRQGDVISLDGSYGKVYGGALDVVAAAAIPEFETLIGWADEARRMEVRANADTPRAARAAVAYGAEGIGLCRTEHMFFAEERLLSVRAMVLADDASQRAEWLARLLPMQVEDFAAIFEAAGGRPVTIRLLDWPLHEFLPREESELAAVAEALRVAVPDIRRAVRAREEVNPMLGHRGVRVGLTLPELYAMQMRAVLEAAQRCQARGIDVAPEIMVPVVAEARELSLVRDVLDGLRGELKDAPEVAFGTMVELPRACLTAERLADYATFFSFGTNDLTQTTFGLSRDDAGRFLRAYLDELEVLRVDPFATLDREGVGQLIERAVTSGRAARPELRLGLCGEHGGDPRSIDFCEEIGLDYVSCSPPRLPIARLAAAQATLRRTPCADEPQ